MTTITELGLLPGQMKAIRALAEKMVSEEVWTRTHEQAGSGLSSLFFGSHTSQPLHVNQILDTVEMHMADALLWGEP